MDRNEKLRLSADAEYGHCFKQGMFVRVYEQSLYWFVTHVKPLKPMQERVKGGDAVVYGGLPVASFEKLLAEGAITSAETTEYGWRWPYAARPDGKEENAAAFQSWRETALAAEAPLQSASNCGRDILRELRAFNIAGSTPMQAMTAVAGWQDYLRNREGAG